MIKTANENKTKPMDLFRQAMGSFETALRTGVKLQEESVQRCTEILRDVGSPMEWERTSPAKVTRAIAAIQQNVDQSIRYMDENAQQTVSLMEMALETHRENSDGGEEDGYFWTYALHAMRTNAQIIRQANTNVLESWANLAKEVLERVETMRKEVDRVTELAMRQV
jgi:hypothetical protein